MKLTIKLTLIMLAMGLVFAPSAWTQDKPFTEQEVLDMVKAGLGNDAGAQLVLKRGIDFEPTARFIKLLKSAGAKDAFLKSLRANEPFTQEEVSHMVKAGLGEESGAESITQRGINFTPTETYLQTLKAAGSKDVFINAMRDRMSLNQVQIVAQLAADTPTQNVTTLVKDRGVTFTVKDDYLQEVRLAGGDDELIAALKNAKVKAPTADDTAAQTTLDQMAQHVAHGAGLKLKGQYPDAEKEFHQALSLGGPNTDIDIALATVQGQQKEWDDEAATAREVLKMNPNSEKAHIMIGVAYGGKGDWDGAEAEDREVLKLNMKSDDGHAYLGVALGGKHDWTGEITEEREALRLNPHNDLARANLGTALVNKGDWDGAVAEYHKALELNPKSELIHCNLAVALGNKGDWDGAIAEYREALRLNRNSDMAHSGLSSALGGKGDWDGAIVEDREVLRLNPNNDQAHVNLADALRNKGDWDGAIAEYHTALKLNSNNELAHAGLGVALGAKDDLDGKISEEHEALRINANNASVHASLADALEQKGDRAGALTEYRAAATLDPKNLNYKQNCERLLTQINR
jgi:tetratricopeptide (TPR) repeat protein